MEDSIQEFKDQMEAWKTEVIELLRLNKPPPPVIDPSLVQGRAHTHPPTLEAGGSIPERRPGKEPARDNDAEIHEVDDEDEGQGENTPLPREYLQVVIDLSVAGDGVLDGWTTVEQRGAGGGAWLRLAVTVAVRS
nr:nuclear poly(A) polymerase 2-like isoform X1 [Ipomoea batatas]